MLKQCIICETMELNKYAQMNTADLKSMIRRKYEGTDYQRGEEW